MPCIHLECPSCHPFSVCLVCGGEVLCHEGLGSHIVLLESHTFAETISDSACGMEGSVDAVTIALGMCGLPGLKLGAQASKADTLELSF